MYLKTKTKYIKQWASFASRSYNYLEEELFCVFV